MLRRKHIGRRLRAAVASVAAYALALQVLFAGVLMGQMSAAALGAGDLAVICAQHSEQTSDLGSGSGQQPAHEASCSLCVLATHAPAVLPATIVATSIDWSASAVRAPTERRIAFAFTSPTGRFQRGPPLAAAPTG
jgi:hypothetical protein